jgi:hypothetical protein
MSNQTNRVFGNPEHPQFPDLIKAGLKVGDKVYSYMYGDGVVTRFTKNKTLPLSVAIKGVELLFMADGRRTIFDNTPSIHIQPWNPVAGEPFPFPKWEPIVGEVYAFWDDTYPGVEAGFVTSRLSKKYNGSRYETTWGHYENCAPISEAMRIFGFDKVGEGAK